MTLAAINKAGVVTPLFEQIRDGKEVGLALAEFDHRLCRGRREAGQYCLDTAHRSGAGGVELLEGPALLRQGIDVGGEWQAAEGADKLGAQALLQQDHQILRFTLEARLVEGLAGQQIGVEITGRTATLLAHDLEHLLRGHLTVKLAGILLGAHLLDGKEEGVGGVDGERVDQRILGKGDHGRVQGAVAETGAGTEKTYGQNEQGEGRTQIPAGEAEATHQTAAQRPTAGQHGAAEEYRQQQLGFAARPQHGEYLFRIDEVLHIEAVGAHAILGDKRGGGDLEEQHQPESDGQPDAHQLQPASADGMGPASSRVSMAGTPQTQQRVAKSTRIPCSSISCQPATASTRSSCQRPRAIRLKEREKARARRRRRRARTGRVAVLDLSCLFLNETLNVCPQTFF